MHQGPNIAISQRIAFRLIAAACLLLPGPTAAQSEYGDITFEPTYRCPGTDVTLRWTERTSEPVTVVVGQEPFKTTQGGELVLPAAIIDATGLSDTFVNLRPPDARYPDPLGEAIVTMRWSKPRWIKPVRTFGYFVEDTFGDMRVVLDPQTWGAGVVVERVILAKYHNVRVPCVEAAFREGADWEVEKDGEVLTTVSAADGYETDLPRAIQAQGEWIFRIRPAAGLQRCAPPVNKDGNGCSCPPLWVTFHLRCAGG